MSEILRLAQTFEAKSNEQAESIEKDVKAAYERHASALTAALSESEASMRDAISGHSRSVRRAVLSSWLAVILVVGSMLLLGSGALWYLGERIQGQLIEIEANERALQELGEMGSKIQFSRCGGRLCARIDLESPEYGERREYRILEGY